MPARYPAVTHSATDVPLSHVLAILPIAALLSKYTVLRFVVIIRAYLPQSESGALAGDVAAAIQFAPTPTRTLRTLQR